MMEFLVGHFNYFMYIVLMMVGFYAMLAKRNLVKKLVGMNIFQWSIILFYVSIACKRGATIPIIEGGHGHHGVELIANASQYISPLPHVLMLTAIVVGVGTTGVSLALLLTLYKKYKTLEEDEIMRKF
ncbi:MAG: cation:proton antiporter subunit C [Deltaproteobacteria bacterium]|nr:cation:proton antiporter subunit C [Deltaproteobacteria bacterium]